MVDSLKLQALIKQELINWATHVLSVKTEYYNDNPPCPFALSALEQGFAHVKYGFGPYMKVTLCRLSLTIQKKCRWSYMHK